MQWLTKLIVVCAACVAAVAVASDEPETKKQKHLLDLEVSNASADALQERTKYLVENSDKIPDVVKLLTEQYDLLTDRLHAKKRRNEQIVIVRKQTAEFLYTKVGQTSEAFLFLLQQMHGESVDRLHLSDIFANATIAKSLSSASPDFFLKIAQMEKGESSLFALFIVSELTVRGFYVGKDAIKSSASNIFSSKYETFADELSYRLMADPQLLLLTSFNLPDTLFKHKVWKSPFLYAVNKLRSNSEISDSKIRQLAHMNSERDLDFLWSFTDSLRHAAALRPTDSSRYLNEYHSDLYNLIEFAEHTIATIGRAYPNDARILRCIYSFYAVRTFITFRNLGIAGEPERDDNLENFRKDFGRVGPLMANCGMWIEQFAAYENYGLILRHIHNAMFSPEVAITEFESLKRLATWNTHQPRCQTTFTVEAEHFIF